MGADIVERTKPWVSLIAAVADNQVIGHDNHLPWHLPEDLRHFKKITQYKPVIMGRRTYESLGKPLPNRLNIVVSRSYQGEGAAQQQNRVQIAASLEEAIQAGTRFYEQNYPYTSEHPDAEHSWEIMVIGGAQLYKAALPSVQRMYITQVHISVAGDCYFPDWQTQPLTQAHKDGPHQSSKGIKYTFVELERITN